MLEDQSWGDVAAAVADAHRSEIKPLPPRSETFFAPVPLRYDFVLPKTTPTEQANERARRGNIQIRGTEPHPHLLPELTLESKRDNDVTDYDGLGIHGAIRDTLVEHGWRAAFPIQAAVIPAALAGRDVIATAPTGSGKTLSYAIPAVVFASRQPSAPSSAGPSVLVLVPSRELGYQVANVMTKLAAATTVAVHAAVGGRTVAADVAAARRGVDILIATPGRAIELGRMQDGRLMGFTRVGLVIVDEADALLRAGSVGAQTLHLLSRALPPPGAEGAVDEFELAAAAARDEERDRRARGGGRTPPQAAGTTARAPAPPTAAETAPAAAAAAAAQPAAAAAAVPAPPQPRAVVLLDDPLDESDNDDATPTTAAATVATTSATATVTDDVAMTATPALPLSTKDVDEASVGVSDEHHTPVPTIPTTTTTTATSRPSAATRPAPAVASSSDPKSDAQSSSPPPPPTRQTLLFSATLPRDITRAAHRITAPSRLCVTLARSSRVAAWIDQQVVVCDDPEERLAGIETICRAVLTGGELPTFELKRPIGGGGVQVMLHAITAPPSRSNVAAAAAAAAADEPMGVGRGAAGDAGGAVVGANGAGEAGSTVAGSEARASSSAPGPRPPRGGGGRGGGRPHGPLVVPISAQQRAVQRSAAESAVRVSGQLLLLTAVPTGGSAAAAGGASGTSQAESSSAAALSVPGGGVVAIGAHHGTVGPLGSAAKASATATASSRPLPAGPLALVPYDVAVSNEDALRGALLVKTTPVPDAVAAGRYERALAAVPTAIQHWEKRKDSLTTAAASATASAAAAAGGGGDRDAGAPDAAAGGGGDCTVPGAVAAGDGVLTLTAVDASDPTVAGSGGARQPHQRDGSLIIIAQSIDDAHTLAADLTLRGFGDEIITTAGKASDEERLTAMIDFTQRRRRILVATPSVLRGIDVAFVRAVVLARPPPSLEEYIHCAGRCGRAGRSGSVYSFLIRGVDDDVADVVVKALEGCDVAVPTALLQMVQTQARRVAVGVALPSTGRVKGFVPRLTAGPSGEGAAAAPLMLMDRHRGGRDADGAGGEARKGGRRRRGRDGGDDDDDENAQHGRGGGGGGKRQRGRADDGAAPTASAAARGGASAEAQLFSETADGDAQAAADALEEAFERAAVVREKGRWTVKVSIEDIPPTIRDRLLSRSAHSDVFAKHHVRVVVRGDATTAARGPRAAAAGADGEGGLSLWFVGDTEGDLQAAQESLRQHMLDHAERHRLWAQRSGAAGFR